VNKYFILLAVLQGLNLFLHWWAQENFAKPKLIQPSVFKNPVIGLLLIIAPNIIGLILIVLAFFYTESPWLFLGLSIAGFVAFAKSR
jgi:hypothetical protein